MQADRPPPRTGTAHPRWHKPWTWPRGAGPGPTLGLRRRRRIKKRFNARLAASSRFIAADGPGRTTAGGPGRTTAGGPPLQPARLEHLTPHQVTRHVLKLDDGQQVGLSVAGAGVPFVLLHGIGLHNRTYEQVLSYLPEFGFLAVAIEAPGHGRSSPVPRGADFATRVDLIRRALDALGIRRAVVAGHSMGGRSAACLTAAVPDRVLAALFVDAALGEDFDLAVIKQLRSEAATVRSLVDGIVDVTSDARNIPWHERLAYYRMLSGPGRPHLADLARTPEVARAIAVNESEVWLAAIRDAAVPAAVLHGAHDLVVPLADATAVAGRLGAPLLTLPAGYHSWLLASPRTFAAIVAEIFADLTAIAGPAGRCFDPGAHALEWAAAPPRLLPPRLDETVLGWQIERPAPEASRPRRRMVSGTRRLACAWGTRTGNRR
jgi:pimeloyl-ACP methyl ester carboxylesterase